MGWRKPEWPDKPIILPSPDELAPFHDDAHGPLIGVFPKKYKSSSKLTLQRRVIPVYDCGTQERMGRAIKLMRMDHDVANHELGNNNVTLMIHLGIGHFKNNPYRQRSPYIYSCDDKIYARISIKKRRKWWRTSWKNTNITWMLSAGGCRLYKALWRQTVYSGFYEVKQEESDELRADIKRRVQMALEFLI